MRADANLPKVLVIDDQFGRWTLGDAFRRAVGPEIYRLFVADRDNLCRNFGLRAEGVRGGPEDPLAVVSFCPAQEWDEATSEIRNLPESAIERIRDGWPFPDGSRWALILLDLRFTFGPLNRFGDPELGNLLGADVILPALRRSFGESLPVVILSSLSREDVNARVRNLGALDFIQRIPGAGAPPEESRRSLSRVLTLHGLLPDPEELVVGRSLPTLLMLRLARRAALSARTVLLEGETGTGKGLLARFIHLASSRRDGPFETFNAGNRPAELQADELFGHWKGAFTGATEAVPGLFERGRGGTVFIDEVADLDLELQSRLMQPIEERRVRRVGHPPARQAAEFDVDVTVILATNRTLQTERGVRRDFLNRVDAFVIEVPPLRARPEDITSLSVALCSKLHPGWRGRLLPETLTALTRREYREGNIRELRGLLDRAITNNPDQDLAPDDLSPRTTDAPSSPSAKARVESADPVSVFLTSRGLPLGTLRIDELTGIRESARGFLPMLLADALVWALSLTAVEGRPNHCEAVRLLLGRDDVDGMQARRIMKKILALDPRGGTVWKAYRGLRQHPTSPLVERLLAQLAARRSES